MVLLEERCVSRLKKCCVLILIVYATSVIILGAYAEAVHGLGAHRRRREYQAQGGNVKR